MVNGEANDDRIKELNDCKVNCPIPVFSSDR